jgi:hypothetical protein
MSEKRGEAVDLVYIGRALQRFTGDVAGLKDDMRVLTAIVMRQDRQFEGLSDDLRDLARQLTAMVAQHARMADRLDGIRDRLDSIEGRVDALGEH